MNGNNGISEMNRCRQLSVLCIDNFDSFVFNLVDEFEKRGCNVTVWRNDTPLEKLLDLVAEFHTPGLVLLSPGPGTPTDAGCCVPLIQQVRATVPIFGVCLGHQAIVEAFGGEVGAAGEIVHGKASSIVHQQQGVFEGLSSPLTVGRYHSLVGQTIPASLRVIAELDQMVMAVQHVSRPICGVQFHPESILTSKGGLFIENVIQWAVGQGEK